MLSKHDSAIQEAGGAFKIDNKLRRKLRDSGVAVTEEDGQTYLYLHGLSLLKGAPFNEKRDEFTREAKRLKKFFASNGLKAHVHASTYRTSEENELSELMGKHFDGFWNTLSRYSPGFNGLHSLVLRVQVPPEAAAELNQAVARWSATGSLKDTQRRVGYHVLLSCLDPKRRGVPSYTVRIARPRRRSLSA